jgi:hypothetical protein
VMVGTLAHVKRYARGLHALLEDRCNSAAYLWA